MGIWRFLPTYLRQRRGNSSASLGWFFTGVNDVPPAMLAGNLVNGAGLVMAQVIDFYVIWCTI